MTLETRERIGKLYKENKWNKKDKGAAKCAEQLKEEVAVIEEPKKKKGRR